MKHMHNIITDYLLRIIEVTGVGSALGSASQDLHVLCSVHMENIQVTHHNFSHLRWNALSKWVVNEHW
jgi:hypothetical protein